MGWKPRLIPGGRTEEPRRAPSDEGESSDADLVQRVLQGLPAQGPSRLPGHDAFAALVERHELQVLRLARHLLRDPDGARDVAQDAFLRAFRSLSSYRPELSFRSWILKITVNAARDHQARKASWRLRPLADGADIAASGSGAAEVEGALLLEHVRRLAAELSPREREVFVLRDLEGMETEDIAEVLGLEAPTVRRHLARARLRLRELLSVADETPEGGDAPPEADD